MTFIVEKILGWISVQNTLDKQNILKLKLLMKMSPRVFKDGQCFSRYSFREETHFNRKADNWSSSHGQFNELVRSTPDLNAQRSQSPNGSPKHCWSRSNRIEAVALGVVQQLDLRPENRGRTRGGLAVHGRDFSDSKDDAKRSNWEDMTALQPTRRSGITHKESKGLFPALDPNDDLGRNISLVLNQGGNISIILIPRHGCSQSEGIGRLHLETRLQMKMVTLWRPSGGWSAALDQFEEWEGKISADQRWQRRSHSISPKHSWYTRKRSRSPSPSLGLKPGTESWNNRGRTGTGGSAAPYRDFPTEKFGKGSHFRELGEDDAWRHSDNLSREIGESRFGRGGYSGYHGWEDFNDSLEGKDYSRDRLLQRELSHHDGVWEKLERHKNNRSTEHHYVSTKERFPRGSSCNYVHHDVNSYGPWPMRDGARDRNYDRRDADSPFRQRFKSTWELVIHLVQVFC
ncbi:hypothetical protein J5N97_011398 [Dioscorea zingiberensis]|uniref:Uncharacterized protein n=1 Tax=Dioscorea zingiberensis TaxID=325984 RepID=A0A9D5D123_9LILI|nr:hypothetical protein J5N97_011398 [Dioscorea zingiberensis]